MWEQIKVRVCLTGLSQELGGKGLMCAICNVTPTVYILKDL